MKKVVAVLAALAMLVVVAGTSLLSATSASAATPGTSPQNPIVVGSVSEVPASAVEDATSTYNTAAECDTTRSWVNVKPAVNEVSHQEWRAETRTQTKTPTVEYRWMKQAREWVPAVEEVKVYSYKKVTPAVQEVKEYTFDKFVQKQKAKWNGNTYVGPISANYPGSYTWRDAGYDPVKNTTGVTPTAPGPQRGEFIHNNGGTWYFTYFYEYRKIGERVVTQGQPEKVEYSGERTTTLPSPWVLLSGYPKVKTAGVPAHWGPWVNAGYTNWGPSSTPPSGNDTTQYVNREQQPGQPVYGGWGEWVPFGTNPYLSDPQLPVNTDTQEYRKFGPFKVIDSAAQPEVRTYYAWSDGKVCTTTTPTPTPEPPKVKKKPAAKIRAACTGQVVYLLNNSKSNVAVPFKYARNGIVKTVKVKAGKTKVIVKQARAYSVAWVKAPKMKTVKTRVPWPCTVPHSGR